MPRLDCGNATLLVGIPNSDGASILSLEDLSRIKPMGFGDESAATQLTTFLRIGYDFILSF